MGRYNPKEHVGVDAVSKIVHEELGWIFRPQPIDDMGIDAHIETVDEDNNPTGKVIGVQIKTGESHVVEHEDHYRYYITDTHWSYWIDHSLPVILIIHLPEKSKTLWVKIDNETVTETKTQYKVDIPKNSIFSVKIKSDLEEYSEGTKEQRRLRRLLLDYSIMKEIKNGRNVIITAQEWVNKFLGRSPIKIFYEDQDGQEEIMQEWYMTYTRHTLTEAIEILIPWCNLEIDEEFYDINEDCDDDNCDYCDDSSDEIGNSIKSKNVIRPYVNLQNEVDMYRFKLNLNDIGESFIKIAEYLSS